MSIRITTKDNTDELRVELDKTEYLLKNIGEKVVNDIADMLVISVKNEINEQGLYGTGELYDSVAKEDTGDKIVVFVGAPHARFLEYGTKASEGRYVRAIDRRLVNPRREFPAWGKEGTVEFFVDIGTHPGVQSYGFFDYGVQRVIDFTDDMWLKEQAKDVE